MHLDTFVSSVENGDLFGCCVVKRGTFVVNVCCEVEPDLLRTVTISVGHFCWILCCAIYTRHCPEDGYVWWIKTIH